MDYIINNFILHIAIIQIFSVTKFISTVVVAEWSSVTGVSHYTVYYESSNGTSRMKKQVDAGMRIFSWDVTEGIVGGLDSNLNYMFSISTSFYVNGNIYEGKRNNPIPPGLLRDCTISIRV